jgi:hypothetical protein
LRSTLISSGRAAAIRAGVQNCCTCCGVGEDGQAAAAGRALAAIARRASARAASASGTVRRRAVFKWPGTDGTLVTADERSVVS